LPGKTLSKPGKEGILKRKTINKLFACITYQADLPQGKNNK
jgi:hypothetical protein